MNIFTKYNPHYRSDAKNKYVLSYYEEFVDIFISMLTPKKTILTIPVIVVVIVTFSAPFFYHEHTTL